MFSAEGADPYHFLLVLFGVLFADGIAIQQLIIDVVGIVSLLALFLLLYCLFYHSHHYFLEVVQGHQICSYVVSVVVVIILLEE